MAMHWQLAHTSTYPPPSPSPGRSQPARAQGETLVGREAEHRWVSHSVTSEHRVVLQHPKFYTSNQTSVQPFHLYELLISLKLPPTSLAALSFSTAAELARIQDGCCVLLTPVQQ